MLKVIRSLLLKIVDDIDAGFKELPWNKKTLDEFIRRSKHEK